MSLALSFRSLFFRNRLSSIFNPTGFTEQSCSILFPQNNNKKVTFSDALNSPWQKLGEKIESFWEYLNDCILKAVPKKKTSYSKKRMRAAGKGIKNLENIVTCHSCGKPKLMHQICTYCLKEFRSRARESTVSNNLNL